MESKTICLVLIFKNEEAVLQQTLEAVAPYINSAVFVDGDSSDNSKYIIKSFFQANHDIPYRFANWSHAPYRSDEKRTYAMTLAKDRADYLLMIDADNIFEVDIMNQLTAGPYTLGDLTAECYHINKKLDDIDYPFPCLFKGDLDWQWEGIIHETPCLADHRPFTQAVLPGVVIHEMTKGAGGRERDIKKHYADHALILEREILDNAATIRPDLLSRYIFYLGNSYKDAGMGARAIDAYRARIAMGGWDEEIFYSLYMTAKLKNTSEAAFIAWNYRPHRLEAAFFLMQLLEDAGLLHAALAVGIHATDIAILRPARDMLFVETEVYDTLMYTQILFLKEKLGLHEKSPA